MVCLAAGTYFEPEIGLATLRRSLHKIRGWRLFLPELCLVLLVRLCHSVLDTKGAAPRGRGLSA